MGHYKDKNILITGGLGFIGSNLANELVKCDANVTIFDANIDRYGANYHNISDIRNDVCVVERDIRQKNNISGEVRDSDIIFHLAAQLSRTYSMENPQYDNDINCKGTLNILKSIKKSGRDIPIIFSSSQSVYGVPDELPITERTSTNPIDIYGTNKLTAEEYIRVFSRAYGISYSIGRFTNVYGPRAQLGNPQYGVINKFIKSALNGGELTVYEPGTMKRDFIFVEDVVDALLSLGENVTKKEQNGIYIVGSGEKISIRRMAETIVDCSNSGEVVLTDWPSDWGSIQIGDLSFNIQKLKDILDWEPTTDFKCGVEATIRFYQDNINEYDI
jgi:nucleoside-diphosphate-sugar epimerase